MNKENVDSNTEIIKGRNVIGCARCGSNHDSIEFKKFKKKPPKYTHWGMCPITNEPVLMFLTNP